VFFSCKKETTTDFTKTDVTGFTTVKGTCTKNVITPNGSGGWMSSSRIPAAGVSVQFKVNKNQLYPASIAQGADVYSATSDAQGNWAVSVKTNANGVNAYMTLAGFNGTQDTIINGVTKTGLYANYFGATANLNLVMGTTYDYGVYDFTASNLTSNPNNIMIGSAALSGSISMNQALKVTTGTVITTGGSTNVAVPAGITVYMTLDKDPTLLAPKMYTTTTTAGGRYSFTFPTVASGTSGFAQNGTIWVADYATTRDTFQILNGNNSSLITGPTGVYGNSSTNENSLFNNENRNATNFSFGGFTQN
jgi:hypothetical protein